MKTAPICFFLTLALHSALTAAKPACVSRLLAASSPATYSSFTEEDWRRTYHESVTNADDYAARTALYHLIYLNAKELGLSFIERLALRNYLSMLNLPQAMQAGRGRRIPLVTGPGFFKSALYLENIAQSQDAVGGRLGFARRAGNVTRSMLKDLIWATGPFALRFAPTHFWVERIAWKISSLDADKVAAAVNLSNDATFLRILTHRRSGLISNQVHNFRSALGQYARTLFLAAVLFDADLHPGEMFFEKWRATPTADQQDWERSMRWIIQATSVELEAFRALSEKEGFSTQDKNVKLIINDELWNGWWNRSEEMFYSTPEYAEMAKQAKRFEIVPFRGHHGFVKGINDTSDEDVLILMTHGTVEGGAMVVPRSYVPFPLSLISSVDSAQLIEQIEEKPLKPGAQIFYLVCSFGDCMHEPKSLEEEEWVALAKKKLHPAGGKAYVSTENILTPVAMNKLAELLKTTGEAMGYSVVGPYVYSPGFRGDAQQRAWQDYSLRSVPGHFSDGIRVYDRALGTDKFVPLEAASER